MQCKYVKIVGGQRIPCTDVNPNQFMPGFFDLWQEDGSRRIVNGEAIVEIVEGGVVKDSDFLAQH